METKVKQKRVKVQTIDITVLEWFDKVNGNSYFAGSVCVNYGMGNEVNFNMPFQYGYGDSGYYKALDILCEFGYIEKTNSIYLRDKGIKVNYNKYENRKRKELQEYE